MFELIQVAEIEHYKFELQYYTNSTWLNEISQRGTEIILKRSDNEDKHI